MSKAYTDYEKENTRKQLEKELDLHESLLAAWEKVTRNYKKNGGTFSNLAKNFNGATLYKRNYSLVDEKELSVCTATKKSGYQTEAIGNKELVKYSDINPDESRIIKESFLEPYFYLTADEMQQRIDETKERHKRRIAELTKALNELDKDNETAEKMLEMIKDFLASVNPDTASIFREKLIRNYY